VVFEHLTGATRRIYTWEGIIERDIGSIIAKEHGLMGMWVHRGWPQKDRYGSESGTYYIIIIQLAQ
jgi:hypothetical protein